MDEFEIQQTISLYHEAASAADWPRVISTFTPEAIWEIKSIGSQFKGHAAICEAFDTLTASLEYVVQINAPALITVDGDTATATSGIRETGKYKDKNEALEVYGVYTDKLVRTADGWKFSHRLFETQWMHRVPILS